MCVYMYVNIDSNQNQQCQRQAGRQPHTVKCGWGLVPGKRRTAVDQMRSLLYKVGYVYVRFVAKIEKASSYPHPHTEFHHPSNSPVVRVDVASLQPRAHLGGTIKWGV